MSVPPQIKTIRCFLHVFQLFVGAKRNAWFLAEKTLTSKNALKQGNLKFHEKLARLMKMFACLNNLVGKVPFFQKQSMPFLYATKGHCHKTRRFC